jgi:hypothetical protein
VFDEQDQAIVQAPVSTDRGVVPTMVLPSRFAETSDVIVPTSTLPSTLAQMTAIPPQHFSLSGLTTAGSP